jgi:hypothetical protein
MRARKFMPGWSIGMLLALAGCAGMQREAPPDVAQQPPEMTAGEAVFEGMKAAEQAAADSAAAEEAAHTGAPPPDAAAASPAAEIATPAAAGSLPAATQLATAVVTAASERARRARPTDRSTEEIRTARPHLHLGPARRRSHRPSLRGQ